jgi:DNA-directed RNA polymerase I, II, and III subunit RPABC2
MDPDEQVDAGGLNPGADEADLVGDEIPQTTAEPATAGQPGDPLEILYKNHPETILDYAETIMPLIPLQQVPPDQVTEGSSRLTGVDGETVAVQTSGDPAHKSQPFMSVYEKTKILGFRANQLAQGARPYIVVPDFVTSTVDIARMELEQRRLPYIIKRPIPNGTFEYWRLSDLMII